MKHLSLLGATIASVVAWSAAAMAEVKEIAFVEAVHNLGYINLYVGQRAGIFEKNGLKLNVTAAGGDTQAFAAVLGKSSPFAIGDATMVQMSREAGGPGIVVGTVVQRAHYFGVSKTLPVLTDAKQFKGLTIVTSPEPNTNFSVTKKLLLDNGMKPQVDAKILEVSPGAEIGAMLAGQADIAIAYQPSVAAAEAQGAKVVFDFSNYVGPFCNTGIMVLPEYAKANPEIVLALVKSFEEAGRLVYADPAYAKKVARLEFPDMPGEVVDKAIDAEIKYRIPAETVVTQDAEWNKLMEMQKFLGNVKGSVAMSEVIDNSFANKAAKEAVSVKAPM
jgi:NitT/TauT family transport system substrate-binding protein